VAGGLLLAGGPAFAQPAPVAPAAAGEGFALQQFEPAPAGDRFFGVSDAGVGPERGFARLLGNYAFKPLTVPDGAGGEVDLVRHQLYAHLGGAVAVADRALLHVDVPLQLANSGEGGAGDVGGGSIGDVRLGMRLRLAGERDGVLALGLGGDVWIASGSAGKLSGDGEARGAPKLFASGRVGSFVYAINGGVLLRKHRDFGREEIGPALAFGAAAGLLLADGALQIGPELYGNTVFEKDGSRSRLLATSSSPFELLAGLRYRSGNLMVGAAAGPGLTRAYGTPAVRTLLSLAYEPPPSAAPVADRDGDGLADGLDACPDLAAPAGANPAKNGCPADRDGDGVFDPQDRCPDLAGVVEKGGCPADRDNDGVSDEQDACPDQPGPIGASSGAQIGCPAPVDGDGDGVPDDKDACPREGGPPDADPAKNGCPQAVRVTDKEILILQQVQFAYGKAEVAPASSSLLDQVAQVLREHPEIAKLEVQGHTDNRGARAVNVRLSQQRAEAVRGELVKRGVDAGRLGAKGYGPDEPKAGNATEEGRRENRRVAFKIVERK
jgi:OmpA-OmpF porin, OOP family